jgi:hypothetical protein
VRATGLATTVLFVLAAAVTAVFVRGGGTAR